MEAFSKISISHISSTCHLVAKPSIRLLVTFPHIIFLGEKKTHKHKNTVVWCPPLAHGEEVTAEMNEEGSAFGRAP